MSRYGYYAFIFFDICSVRQTVGNNTELTDVSAVYEQFILFFYSSCNFQVEVMQTIGNDEDIPKGKKAF